MKMLKDLPVFTGEVILKCDYDVFFTSTVVSGKFSIHYSSRFIEDLGVIPKPGYRITDDIYTNTDVLRIANARKANLLVPINYYGSGGGLNNVFLALKIRDELPGGPLVLDNLRTQGEEFSFLERDEVKK